jgi:hypothetical protein
VQRLHRKLVGKLTDMGLKRKGGELGRLTVTGPSLPSMYLLIKVHKQGFPGRPVVSQVNDPTYNICKQLTDILNPIEQAGESYIRDSYHLKELLKEVTIDEQSKLISFDVKALYPSIPVKQALQIIENELKIDTELPQRTKWKIEDIMSLLSLSLETYFKTLDGRIFKQTEGTPIGKSISGPIAGIYMNYFERNFVYNSKFSTRIRFWKRMKDDVFLIWDGTDRELDIFVNYLNGREKRIQFTIEREEEGKLPFLDMLIMRDDNKLTTKVYRKPTHTQRYIHWTSNHPKNILLGVLKGLIHRAHVLCDKKEDLCEELDLLSDVFVSNGYPQKLVKKTILKSWEIEMKKAIEKDQDNGKTESKEFFDVLHAPYIEGFSEKVQRCMKKLNIGYVMKCGETIQEKICHMKAPRSFEEKKDVVYAIGCKTCGLRYIGETGQKFTEREKQHQSDVRRGVQTNAIFQHLLKNEGHEILWNQPLFLDKESDWTGRKIKESIRINSLNPGEKITRVMNLEKGKSIHPAWERFQEDIAEDTQKKLNARFPER